MGFPIYLHLVQQCFLTYLLLEEMTNQSYLKEGQYLIYSDVFSHWDRSLILHGSFNFVPLCLSSKSTISSLHCAPSLLSSLNSSWDPRIMCSLFVLIVSAVLSIKGSIYMHCISESSLKTRTIAVIFSYSTMSAYILSPSVWWETQKEW